MKQNQIYANGILFLCALNIHPLAMLDSQLGLPGGGDAHMEEEEEE